MVYTAIACDLRRPWTDNLPERIAANAEAWLLSIQQTTEAEEQAAAEMQLDADIAANLPDLVLDLDFRLTLMEELGY